ncbi:ROK family transcriptional regulator [Lacisediminihabitans changchengi]|uniref:ROK family transcriptional regulator n=1 Tax=Lacisediminihabitans changchengi TaxID=2787634 RepID=A0A934W5F5_9MICO|nr:ROK family transcriptional regulator [Lacisediminihabitans changchengi]MBK4348450.1 ROK family transcriptional regulator [Lacisediminihabitans changchengi]
MVEAEPGRTPRGNSNDHLRRHNLSTILRLVHHERAISRSRLTQVMGLNRSTIGALVAELVDRDLVTESEAEATRQVGRPSLVVRPSSGPVGIAVNPEIDAITIGVVGLGGTVLAATRHPLSHIPTAVDAVAIIAGLLDDLRPSLTTAHRIVGVGVAVPGQVRASDGLVRLAPHLGWRDEPFAALLQEATALPVFADNDAHLGARAESAFGGGRGVGDLLYINGGASGIGGGVIANGRPLTGADGYAGELGHTMVNPSGAACHCGGVGCLETEVRRERLLELVGLDAGAAASLAEAFAASDDPAVGAEVDRQLGLLAVAIRNAVNLLNPRLILLGGFLAALHSAAPQRLADFGADRPLAASGESLQIRPAALGPDLLMIGAAELAFEPLLADPASF